MDIKILENIIKENGYSSFRLKQAKKSVFARLVADWDEASDLPADLRTLLKEKAPICSLEPLSREESAKKDALKILFRARDGLLVEAVLMRHDRNRRTVCVSSQVGCAMNCFFCATGKLGFNRNLTAEEIIDQILYFARLLKATDEKITNVVYMGMGEPFNNYDNVMESVKILNDKDGFNLGARHISISTCGIASGIKRFAEENLPSYGDCSARRVRGLQVNLAISLHAPNDEIRSKIMPVNLAYPLGKLMPVIADYVAKTKRKVMFEYILLGGVNDSDECAREVAVLMKANKLYHINLIKYHQTFAKNSATPTFYASSQKQMNRFFDILKKAGVSCTVRISFGEDIAGACGQLAGRPTLIN